MQALRFYRQKLGLTQDEVARKLHINNSESISQYETGARNPPIQVLRKLAKLYNTSIDVLVEDEPATPTDAA
ncbi:hypothetical protein FACS1894184_14030 [Clostridia bacterium]|nr:hypothetical protein FACS1894184_14030 [Clostridia bacterium]